MLNDKTLCEELFHTAGGVAYADFITDGHRETWPIRSKRFRNLVTALLLPGNRSRGERGGDRVSTRSARSTRAI